MGRSKRLEVIFHNGEPEGIRIYMRHLSTIKAFVVPRIFLNDAKTLTDIDNPGVYFLINDEAGSLSKIYIGQTQNGIARLDQHKVIKDFWNKAILFLADSEHFNLNILSGLEKFAIQKAIDANRYDMDNKAVPKYKISEYDMPLIEEIYEEIEFIMGVLGYRMNDTSTKYVEAPFTTSRRGVIAKGAYTGDQFDLLAGSQIDMNKPVNIESYNSKRREYIKDKTIIQKDDGKYYLTKVLSFKSPSGASDFVLGGSTNGWVEWKDKDGQTLDELFR